MKRAIRHWQVLVHMTRHKADKLVTGAPKPLLLAICMCLSPQSVFKAACNLTTIERSHCKGANPVTHRVEWQVTKATVRYINASHSLHPTFMSFVPGSTVKLKGNALASTRHMVNIMQDLA